MRDYAELERQVKQLNVKLNQGPPAFEQYVPRITAIRAAVVPITRAIF